jgi:hypothetical protein
MQTDAILQQIDPTLQYLDLSAIADIPSYLVLKTKEEEAEIISLSPLGEADPMHETEAASCVCVSSANYRGS